VIEIGVTNQQEDVPIDETRLGRAVREVLHEASITVGEVSLAVVDDSTIRRLHDRFLGHDEPTDVLSFVLERAPDRLEGEIVVSGPTARRTAPAYGWSAADELLLYVIHGALHLVGYDDRTSRQRAAMRAAETRTLNRLGVTPPGGQRDRPITAEQKLPEPVNEEVRTHSLRRRIASADRSLRNRDSVNGPPSGAFPT
jgi:probable rRNA maturation factor